MKPDIFLDLIEGLNNALYIGKYVTNYNGNYKKDKKRIKKMLEDIEHGNFSKYLEVSQEEEFDE